MHGSWNLRALTQEELSQVTVRRALGCLLGDILLIELSLPAVPISSSDPLLPVLAALHKDICQCAYLRLSTSSVRHGDCGGIKSKVMTAKGPDVTLGPQFAQFNANSCMCSYKTADNKGDYYSAANVTEQEEPLMEKLF